MISLLLFFGPIAGLVVSLWWFNKYDMLEFYGNPRALKTRLVPASMGFGIFFVGLAFFNILFTDATGLSYIPFIFLGSLMILGVSIVFPYLFSKKGMREWQYVPKWVKLVSQSLAWIGIASIVGLLLYALYYKFGRLVSFAGFIGFIFLIRWRNDRMRKLEALPISNVEKAFTDPGVIKAMQTGQMFDIWKITILLVVAIVLLVGHRLGFW